MTRGRSVRVEGVDGDRGQLVLVAAGFVAVALVPVALAYLQLGYHEDIGASPAVDYEADAVRVLSRGVHEAAGDAPRVGWGRRSQVVTAVRSSLSSDVDTLETARIEEGVAYAVEYNDSAAADWASGRCPGGSGRQFGPCRSERGVVVQRRAGETHAVAVGVDVTITTERGRKRVTLVVRAVGGVAPP